jgi:hypothetical protein
MSVVIGYRCRLQSEYFTNLLYVSSRMREPIFVFFVHVAILRRLLLVQYSLSFSMYLHRPVHWSISIMSELYYPWSIVLNVLHNHNVVIYIPWSFRMSPWAHWWSRSHSSKTSFYISCNLAYLWLGSVTSFIL